MPVSSSLGSPAIRHRLQIRGLTLGLQPLAGVVYLGRSLHTRSLRSLSSAFRCVGHCAAVLLSAITRTCSSDATTVAAAVTAAAAAAAVSCCAGRAGPALSRALADPVNGSPFIVCSVSRYGRATVLILTRCCRSSAVGSSLDTKSKRLEPSTRA